MLQVFILHEQFLVNKLKFNNIFYVAVIIISILLKSTALTNSINIEKQYCDNIFCRIAHRYVTNSTELWS